MEKEKNKISTGTLTYEDIKNKAEYEAGSIGVNVDTSKDAEQKDAGVTPNIGVGAKDDAESTTKATVSEGEIEIRDKENQKQDLTNLNRDTKNSLNKLGEIFDKTKVEERQELAGLFGEVAFNQIHYMKGTKEQKALYHALVGGIMSKLTSGDFLAGASATAINKLVIGEIEKIAGKDPAMMQWLSAALGGVISEVVSKNAEAGAGAASSATKNNDELEAEIAAQNNESAQSVIDAQNHLVLNESDVDRAMQVIKDASGNYKFVPKDNSDVIENLKQSTVINTAIVISDSVLAPGMGITSPTGKFNVLIAVYDDSKKYSGSDFGIAVLSDVAGYAAGNIITGITTGNNVAEVSNNNPVLVVYGTYMSMSTMGNVAGDVLANELKEAFAKTDIQKGAK
ncbi:MAG: hypothetical protein ACLT69_15910 [Intestinibacter bartlettii]